MTKYLYQMMDAETQVYKCFGPYDGHPLDTSALLTNGYKGDLIRADQSIYLDPNNANVLPVLSGEHRGKSFVILESSDTHFKGVEFLDYFKGLTKFLSIAKEHFQESDAYALAIAS